MNDAAQELTITVWKGTFLPTVKEYAQRLANSEQCPVSFVFNDRLYRTTPETPKDENKNTSPPQEAARSVCVHGNPVDEKEPCLLCTIGQSKGKLVGIPTPVDYEKKYAEVVDKYLMLSLKYWRFWRNY